MRFIVTVTGLDFNGTQTADRATTWWPLTFTPRPTWMNAGVRFGFFGQPFNDTNPNDVRGIPFASGVGGTIFQQVGPRRGQQYHLTAQLPNILNGRRTSTSIPPGYPGRDPGQIERIPKSPPTSTRCFLRFPQQLRLRLRSRSGQALAGAERRRHFHQLGLIERGRTALDPGDGAARADRPIKLIETTSVRGNLQHRVAADEHRRLARGARARM